MQCENINGGEALEFFIEKESSRRIETSTINDFPEIIIMIITNSNMDIMINLHIITIKNSLLLKKSMLKHLGWINS